MITWQEFYAEVRTALGGCGVVPDDAVLKALAPTTMRHPPRQLDRPSVKAHRMWALYEQIRAGAVAVPSYFRECLQAAIALWELRLEDLEQIDLGIKVAVSLGTVGTAALALIWHPVAAGTLVFATIGTVTILDAYHRKRIKRALSNIKNRI